jgi:hypothetical protein
MEDSPCRLGSGVGNSANTQIKNAVISPKETVLASHLLDKELFN